MTRQPHVHRFLFPMWARRTELPPLIFECSLCGERCIWHRYAQPPRDW